MNYMTLNAGLSWHMCDATVGFPHVELFGFKCPRLLSWKVIHKFQTTGDRPLIKEELCECKQL